MRKAKQDGTPKPVGLKDLDKEFKNWVQSLTGGGKKTTEEVKVSAGQLILLGKDGKPLPHPLVPVLFNLHKSFSRFASHADVDSFVHRVKVNGAPDEMMLTVEYFQFAENQTERKFMRSRSSTHS